MIKEKVKEIQEKNGKVFDEVEFEEMADEFTGEINEIVNGFTVNISVRGQIINKFYQRLNEIFGITISERLVKKTLVYSDMELNNFFVFLDIIDYFNRNQKLIVNKDLVYIVKEINGIGSPTLFINNTFITIFAKENAVESTLPKVAINEIFSSFTNCIVKLPNNSLSAIIALELKDVYRQNLASFGKGLAGIDERALAYHLNNYQTMEEKYEYLLQIWNNQINMLTISSSDPNYLPENEHFDIHNNINPNDIETELAELVSNIMILPQLPNNENRKIQFGDIFKTEKALRFIKQNGTENSNYEYLLCITPSCDCSHSQKINNNFSFLYGKLANRTTALQHTETKYYSFLSEKVIEWSDKPFTIFIENCKLSSISSNYIRYNDISLKMIYIASMKEMFTQRVSNHAFSKNIRMGVDLPHIRAKS